MIQKNNNGNPCGGNSSSGKDSSQSSSSKDGFLDNALSGVGELLGILGTGGLSSTVSSKK